MLPGDEIAHKVLSKVLAVGFGGVARPAALRLAKRMKSRLLSWKAGGVVDGPAVSSVCTQGNHVFTRCALCLRCCFITITDVAAISIVHSVAE